MRLWGWIPKIYGLGAGILYVGYFFLEVPSNLALERFGARRWIGRIMISWGLVSAACALISGPISFLVLRFLLGAAEAGFFPGVVLYLTYWYPAEYRARIVGLLSLALPVSGLIGSPISGVILSSMNGLAGLGGWQWIFIRRGRAGRHPGRCCHVLPDRQTRRRPVADRPPETLAQRNA